MRFWSYASSVQDCKSAGTLDGRPVCITSGSQQDHRKMSCAHQAYHLISIMDGSC